MKRALMDLCQADPVVLEDMLEQELAEWNARMGWERPGMLHNLRPLLRRRRLSGWVLQVDGRIAGKAFVGAQGGIWSLELAWVAPPYRGAGHLNWLLGEAARRMLAGAPGRRLEVGFFPFGEEEPGALLESMGFQALWRDFMAAEEPAMPSSDGDPLAPWPRRIDPLAELLLQAYRGEPDARSTAFYTRLDGCRTYLETLTRSDECGRFQPALSGVALGPAGALQGLVLGSTLSPGMAHLAQIAVHPDHQGSGLGRSLMSSFLHACAHRGHRQVTLIASRENTTAYDWYRRLGFAAVEPYACFWIPGAARS